MRLGRTKFATSLLLFSLACTVPQLLARKKDDKEKDKGASSPSDRRRALHALNRLTFGPRPGDVQQVMATGVEQWIDMQLHPDKIDDSALNARLEPLRTLRMNTKEIAEDFPALSSRDLAYARLFSRLGGRPGRPRKRLAFRRGPSV